MYTKSAIGKEVKEVQLTRRLNFGAIDVMLKISRDSVTSKVVSRQINNLRYADDTTPLSPKSP